MTKKKSHNLFKLSYLSLIGMFSFSVISQNVLANNILLNEYNKALSFSTEKYDLVEDLTKNFGKITSTLKERNEGIIHSKKEEKENSQKTQKLEKNESKKSEKEQKTSNVKENKKAENNVKKTVDSSNVKLKNREQIVDVKPTKQTPYKKVSADIMPNLSKQQTYSTTCWDSAGKHYGLDPWLLYSIAYVESGFDPNAIGKNKNGTKDLGMMQINDRVWLPKLAKMGITKNMLKDPCMSIYVGAWILKQNINRFGYTKKAIGAYNSLTPHHNKKYSDKVYLAYAKLTKLHKMKNSN